jgi:hypothetical protein
LPEPDPEGEDEDGRDPVAQAAADLAAQAARDRLDDGAGQ